MLPARQKLKSSIHCFKSSRLGHSVLNNRRGTFDTLLVVLHALAFYIIFLYGNIFKGIQFIYFFFFMSNVEKYGKGFFIYMLLMLIYFILFLPEEWNNAK